jgi:hypothetical protein
LSERVKLRAQSLASDREQRRESRNKTENPSMAQINSLLY